MRPSLSACLAMASSKAESSGMIPPHNKWTWLMRQPAEREIRKQLNHTVDMCGCMASDSAEIEFR